jgi:hypothetical protein
MYRLFRKNKKIKFLPKKLHVKRKLNYDNIRIPLTRGASLKLRREKAVLFLNFTGVKVSLVGLV